MVGYIKRMKLLSTRDGKEVWLHQIGRPFILAPPFPGRQYVAIVFSNDETVTDTERQTAADVPGRVSGPAQHPSAVARRCFRDGKSEADNVRRTSGERKSEADDVRLTSGERKSEADNVRLTSGEGKSEADDAGWGFAERWGL